MCREPVDDPRADGRPPEIGDLVTDLSLMLGQARFYGAQHRSVEEARARNAATLRALLRAGGNRPVEIGLADGYLFHDQRPLLGRERGADRLRPLLEELGAGGISFGPESAERDFEVLVELATRGDLGAMGLEHANAHLEAHGARGLRFLGAYAIGDGPADYAAKTLGTKVRRGTEHAGEGVVAVPSRLYDRLFDYLTDTMTGLFSGELFLIEGTKQEVASMLDQLTDDAFPLMNAAAKRTSRADPYLFRHSIRVACVALAVGRQLTRDRNVLLRLGAAALLHDIGKRFIPLDVLYHQGALDAAQRKAMEEHPRHGARLLLQLDDSDPLAVAACFGHHWQQTQAGYPDVEYRVQQSPATRLIKLCDVYEALTAKRPYKAPMSPRKAYRIMMTMGDHFDRALLHRFIRANGTWPAGHEVRLESGALARVQEQTDDFDRPVVRLEGEEELRDLREDRHADLGAVVGFAPEEQAALRA